MQEHENKPLAHENEISYFNAMVSANEKTAKKWQMALIISNMLWAVIVLVFILLWFFTPYEVDFEVGNVQDFNEQQQEQSVDFAQRGN